MLLLSTWICLCAELDDLCSVQLGDRSHGQLWGPKVIPEHQLPSALPFLVLAGPGAGGCAGDGAALQVLAEEEGKDAEPQGVPGGRFTSKAAAMCGLAGASWEQSCSRELLGQP